MKVVDDADGLMQDELFKTPGKAFGIRGSRIEAPTAAKCRLRVTGDQQDTNKQAYCSTPLLTKFSNT